uniref:MARVEL domain-containing protein n=1 Tax=Catagonus wagneri TaxID=51154 RepID=A0A8C3YGA6_9CETA
MNCPKLSPSKATESEHPWAEGPENLCSAVSLVPQPWAHPSFPRESSVRTGLLQCVVGLVLVTGSSWSTMRSTITHACYAALLCLSTAITYSITYVQFLPSGPYRDRAITATAFSCIACVSYAMEVGLTWDLYRLNNVTSYVLTVPGLLKVLETFLACVIFAFISNTALYKEQPALGWCVAVFTICFLQAAVVLMLNLGDCEYRLPIPFPVLQLGLTLLSVLLYTSAVVLWPLYQFDEKLGGQPQRSWDSSCKDELSYYMCAWDQRLAVTVLTAINLLIYVGDLVYWSCLVSVGTEDHQRAPDPIVSPEVSLQSSDVP